MQVETVLGDYTEWKKRNGYFNLLDYVTINCSIEQIALSSILFFPEINFVEGFAFAKQSKQNEFALQYIEQHDDRKAIERYVNCFFLESFFPPKNKKEKNMIVYVIQLLSDIWKMFFERKYPDTVFSIEVIPAIDKSLSPLPFRLMVTQPASSNCELYCTLSCSLTNS